MDCEQEVFKLLKEIHDRVEKNRDTRKVYFTDKHYILFDYEWSNILSKSNLKFSYSPILRIDGGDILTYQDLYNIFRAYKKQDILISILQKEVIDGI